MPLNLRGKQPVVKTIPSLPSASESQKMVFKRASAEKSQSQGTPGVRPSIFNRCSLISSGLESLDAALGGTFLRLSIPGVVC